MTTFESLSPGVAAPNNGRDPADYSVNQSRTECDNCGHAGHKHEKEKVFPDDGPAGSWHWRYVCP